MTQPNQNRHAGRLRIPVADLQNEQIRDALIQKIADEVYRLLLNDTDIQNERKRVSNFSRRSHSRGGR